MSDEVDRIHADGTLDRYDIYNPIWRVEPGPKGWVVLQGTRVVAEVFPDFRGRLPALFNSKVEVRCAVGVTPSH